MGLEEFSMHPGQLLQVRDRLTTLDCKALRRAAPRLFRAHSRDEVEARLLEVVARQDGCA
jgi:phosphotransferase system enzyme I (PtsI)